ncbi:HNH endonuclease signature motif containing protein [Lactobacillaceae bacterium L1_55_11]|nr:HNH endonuclease signature motif containing protein [Lactobacillaceae bacterium L1_55_11]
MGKLLGYVILLGLFLFVVATMLPFVIAAGLGYLAYRIIRYVLKENYFKSDAFINYKNKIDDTIREHNEIAHYADELFNQDVFSFEDRATGVDNQSNLATFENTSRDNYVRDRNIKELDNSHTRNVSLQIVRKASEDPIKYLTQYFNIKPTEENLEQIQEIGENVSRIENAVANLKERESDITKGFNPPKFILKHYKKEFMEKTGVEFAEITIPYAEYKFQYVSAGGNSSQITRIKLNGDVIEAISSFLADKIKFNKTVEGQRALMTNNLRTEIKVRDQYACQLCGLSTNDEPHLLLEIDHILPVSKGGLTARENLQTLCWKCNRSKSNKVA